MRMAKIAVGFVLLLSGVAMLALPGPGWLTIAAALAILAGEFAWARRTLEWVNATTTRGRDAITRRRTDGQNVAGTNHDDRRRRSS